MFIARHMFKIICVVWFNFFIQICTISCMEIEMWRNFWRAVYVYQCFSYLLAKFILTKQFVNSFKYVIKTLLCFLCTISVRQDSCNMLFEFCSKQLNHLLNNIFVDSRRNTTISLKQNIYILLLFSEGKNDGILLKPARVCHTRYKKVD